PHGGPVREHHVHRLQVIDGEPVLAAQIPDTAGRRQTADADTAVIARSQCPAVGLQGGGDVAPPGAGADAHQPAIPVEHLDVVQGADVDDQAAVVRRSAADAVTAAADSERDVPVASSERDRVDDVADRLRAQDQSG